MSEITVVTRASRAGLCGTGDDYGFCSSPDGDKQRGEVIQIICSKGRALREMGSPMRRLLQLSRRELVVVTGATGLVSQDRP